MWYDDPSYTEIYVTTEGSKPTGGTAKWISRAHLTGRDFRNRQSDMYVTWKTTTVESDMTAKATDEQRYRLYYSNSLCQYSSHRLALVGALWWTVATILLTGMSWYNMGQIRLREREIIEVKFNLLHWAFYCSLERYKLAKLGILYCNVQSKPLCLMELEFGYIT